MHGGTQNADARRHTAASDTRDCTRDNELVHCLRKTAEQTPGSEDGVGREQASFPPKDVAKLAVEWSGGFSEYKSLSVGTLSRTGSSSM
jgi:hypothetical protein